MRFQILGDYCLTSGLSVVLDQISETGKCTVDLAQSNLVLLFCKLEYRMSRSSLI